MEFALDARTEDLRESLFDFIGSHIFTWPSPSFTRRHPRKECDPASAPLSASGPPPVPDPAGAGRDLFSPSLIEAVFPTQPTRAGAP